MDHDTGPFGTNPTGIERRISPRYPAGQIVFDLVVETPRPWFRKPTLERLPARVLDLSVEGARVLAPDRDELQEGVRFRLEADGHAVAEIRHRRPASMPGWAIYGLRFVSMDDDFRERLYRYVGQGRQWLRRAWLSAR